MRQRFRCIRISLVLLMALVPSGCNGLLGWGGDVEIRIRNASTYDFVKVIVGFPEQTEDYGAVPAAGISGYRVISKAYSYAGVEVTLSDNRKLVIVPTDYVGESTLGNGRYTYQLGVSSDGLSLTSQLVVD
jgi:hypothetical protein